ncbi:DUF6415 family natural product biosynthesis protein [Streptomyces cinnamoneus]|uniref:DUF6415 family natural product biosynthesis protein n=1 Tax=Streptomyces cinnamoneus TaxID=53446 RepID=UPI003417CF36
MNATAMAARVPDHAHVVVPADGPERSARLDVVTVTRTVSEALRPLPQGATLDPEALAASVELLTGHIRLLLPLAEAAYNRSRPPEMKGPGLVGHGLAYVLRRMAWDAPDPDASPHGAHAWVQDSARCVQQLLGLALAGERGRQHAGGAR